VESVTPSSSPSCAYPRTRLAVAVVLVGFGAFWLYWAYRCDLRYAERHLLDNFVAASSHDHVVARTYRLVLSALGVVSLAGAPFAARWAGRVGPAEAAGATFRMGIALALSLVASEIGMRVLHLPRGADISHLTQVRIGQPDPRYGWLYIASRASVLDHGKRDIEYAIDADHDRVPSASFVTDPSLPSILFAGESITMGHGLTWDETYPAIVGRSLDLQVVNLAVHGYGLDQAYLRLHDALPRFEHPVAVVSFFLVPMVPRMEEDTHPRLVFDGVEAKLEPSRGFWHDMHLAAAWRWLVPYRDDGVIQLAARLLKDEERMAQARGAKPLFVAPRFGPTRVDQYLFDELFTQQGLDVVDVDFRWEQLPGDSHPNPVSTRRLADAVVAALRRELAMR
jgi:hypothetical protein